MNSKSQIQRKSRRIKKTIEIKSEEYRRFLTLAKKYAWPHVGKISILIGFSLLLSVMAMLTLAFSAGMIQMFVGNLSAGATEVAQTAGKPGNPLSDVFNLNQIGSTVLSWVKPEAETDLMQIGIRLSIGLLLVMGVQKILEYGNSILGALVSNQINSRMRCDLFAYVLNFDMRFFNKQKPGELLSRMGADVSEAIGNLQKVIISLVSSGATLVLYVVIVLKTSPMLLVAIFVTGVAHEIVNQIFNRPFRYFAKRTMNDRAVLSQRMLQVLANMRIVKSFGAEKDEIKHTEQLIDTAVRNSMKREYLLQIEGPVRAVINNLMQIMILLFTVYEVKSNRITPLAAMIFVYMAKQIMSPVNQLVGAHNKILGMMGASRRFYQYYQVPILVKEGSEILQGFHKQIAFEKVTFAYEKAAVLSEVSVEIKKGETVALVGPSGAGKSTFVDLVLRFYDPTQGCLKIDGRDLRDYTQKSYRSLIGYVPQDPVLFNATLEENIRYAKPDATDAEIREAAKIANAEEFIEELPMKYKTLVGERGIRLSGGQRQRIAIARAAVKRPELLILDEATSSLDSHSERLVQAAIDQMTQASTAIIIAHRLSTILHADKIVVIDRGIVQDVGPHRELIQRCPLYKRLYEIQFQNHNPEKSDELV